MCFRYVIFFFPPPPNASPLSLACIAQSSVRSVVAGEVAVGVVAAASFGVRYSFVLSTRDTSLWLLVHVSQFSLVPVEQWYSQMVANGPLGVMCVPFKWQNIQITSRSVGSMQRTHTAHTDLWKFDCSFFCRRLFFARFFWWRCCFDPNEREITLTSTKIVSNGWNNSSRAVAPAHLHTPHLFFSWFFASSFFEFYSFFCFTSYSGCWLFGKNLYRLHNFLSFSSSALVCVCASERCASDYYYHYYDYYCYYYSCVKKRQACHVHTKSTNNFSQSAATNRWKTTDEKVREGRGDEGEGERRARAKVFPTAYEPNANTHKLCECDDGTVWGRVPVGISRLIYSFCNIIICVGQAEATHRRNIIIIPSYKYTYSEKRESTSTVRMFLRRQQHAHSTSSVKRWRWRRCGPALCTAICDGWEMGWERNSNRRAISGAMPASTAPTAAPIARNRNAMCGCETRAALWKTEIFIHTLRTISTWILWRTFWSGEQRRWKALDIRRVRLYSMDKFKLNIWVCGVVSLLLLLTANDRANTRCTWMNGRYSTMVL